MNKYISIFIAFFFTINCSYAQLQANFSYCTFNSPDNNPYIETYLSVIGNSVIIKRNEKNNYQGGVEVTYLFKQDHQIKKFEKFSLLGTEVQDSLSSRNDFVNQQRISLPNGNYELEIMINDINSNSSPFTNSQPLIVDYQPNSIDISDIELIASAKRSQGKPTIISKNGYELLPYASDFYPESFDQIVFYAEIYHADKVLDLNEAYLISYSIKSTETKQIIGNYSGFTREVAQPVSVLLKSFSIKNLYSGNYNLVIEVKNKNNELLVSKQIFFQRSNPKSTPLFISDNYGNHLYLT